MLPAQEGPWVGREWNVSSLREYINKYTFPIFENSVLMERLLHCIAIHDLKYCFELQSIYYILDVYTVVKYHEKIRMTLQSV